MSAFVLRGRALLGSSERWYPSGALLVARGRVVECLRSAAAVRRAGAIVIDAGDVLLAPGLVNAHAHLDLTGLGARAPRGRDFGAWVRGVIAFRAERSARELSADAADGARRCIAAGTTSVGDIDASGACERALAAIELRLWSYREALDAHDPRRTRAVVKRVVQPMPRRALRTEALSPHAPFTVSRALFAELGRIARRRRLPVSMHWSETRVEIDWLRDGSGALAALLGESPRASGLDLLEEAGLLRAPLSLVHGNFPARGEAERIAAAGAVVVHCPGSHAWFDREPFPLEHYRRRGVALALGTDSLASNDALDLRREMALLRREHPNLRPDFVWDMATRSGARALGAAGRVGELIPGAAADICAFRTDADTRTDALEQLTSSAPAVAGVWIAGRGVRP